MQEDLDAYEFVFDGRRESGGHRFDAGFVGEVEEESGSVSTVVNLVDLFNGSDESQLAKRLQELDAAAGVLDSARLLGVIDELGLSAPRKVVPEKSTLQIHVVAPNVTFARSVLQNTHVYDHQYLERVANALSAPSAIQGFLDVAVDHSQILETAVTSGAVFVCPVSATEIAKWPGIEHRELFDLNVRLKLGTKRVRQSLDEALRSAQGAGDFLASHNGLTVVCDAVEVTDNGLRVTNFSVVNGTQSAIAFFENRHNLDPDIRVLVKFAAVDTTSETARQIAIRSNTQNPVNTRNLRALDARDSCYVPSSNRLATMSTRSDPIRAGPLLRPSLGTTTPLSCCAHCTTRDRGLP